MIALGVILLVLAAAAIFICGAAAGSQEGGSALVFGCIGVLVLIFGSICLANGSSSDAPAASLSYRQYGDTLVVKCGMETAELPLQRYAPASAPAPQPPPQVPAEAPSAPTQPQ